MNQQEQFTTARAMLQRNLYQVRRSRRKRSEWAVYAYGIVYQCSEQEVIAWAERLKARTNDSPSV